MSHHADHFNGAVAALVAHGPIKTRLIRAYENHLQLIEDEKVPLEVRKSFAELQSLMHGVTPANGEGPICASVRKMSKIEAVRCARLIVEICHGVLRHSDDIQATLPLAMDSQQSIPPFLVKSV